MWVEQKHKGQAFGLEFNMMNRWENMMECWCVLKIIKELCSKGIGSMIADAEENLRESEVRKAHLAKFLYFIQIAEKEKALEQLKVTENKTVDVGQKMDLVFYSLQIGFFYMDFDLISKSIDKSKNLFEKGGDSERKNRLKVYEGLYCMSTRNFKKAAT
ncbi:hypothetical protein J1N35_038947 [Gossypium stocksii]|uniref:26S proteasome regulatory subunit Rpn7 N-terminal domain-containing protein n=1 Tax=Gossypium stocksii TaxID=47602 RepID=A0A9D3UMU0_9ROSI|nr:hypothetical protein J1N35_038947 [Gossypium stocksii]